MGLQQICIQSQKMLNDLWVWILAQIVQQRLRMIKGRLAYEPKLALVQMFKPVFFGRIGRVSAYGCIHLETVFGKMDRQWVWVGAKGWPMNVLMELDANLNCFGGWIST